MVRVRRKVLWTSDEEDGEAVEQERSNEDGEGAILSLDIGSGEKVDTRREREYRTENEVTERSLDQFLTDDHQVRTVHPDLKKEALAILST